MTTVENKLASHQAKPLGHVNAPRQVLVGRLRFDVRNL